MDRDGSKFHIGELAYSVGRLTDSWHRHIRPMAPAGLKVNELGGEAVKQSVEVDVA
jgi:predicted transcriptional regulator